MCPEFTESELSVVLRVRAYEVLSELVLLSGYLGVGVVELASMLGAEVVRQAEVGEYLCGGILDE